jgi:hypothetical protein
MALVDIPFFGLPLPHAASAVGASSLIDAASERAWSLHGVMRSGGGNIRNIHFRTNTVTTGATVDCRIETVDTSGQPSGTLWATNTNISQVIADADDNVLFRTANLTASATVAIGDIIAIVIETPSGNLNIARPMAVVGSRGFPYPGGPLNTNKVDLSGGQFAIEYDDGIIEMAPYTVAGCFSPTTVSVSTATNPDEVSNLFTCPMSCRCVGWWAALALSASITYRISLYQSGNNTPLATSTMDSDYTTSAAIRTYMNAWDDITNGITLSAATDYRIAFCALSGTNTSTFRNTVERNGVFRSLGLPGIQASVRNRSGTTDPDSAAWTETSTQMYQIGILLDQVDNGAGAGGLAIPVSGRIVT